MISSRSKLHEGSVKVIWAIGSDVLHFENTDHFSAFDRGRHPQTIPGQAYALTKCAVASFKIAKQIGTRTHFIEQVNDTTIAVRRLATPKESSETDTNHVLPLELIDRIRVGGGLARDLASGVKNPVDYGFDEGYVPKQGELLPSPVFEITTKREKFDRPLTDEEAMRIAGINRKKLDEIKSVIIHYNGALSLAAKAAGYDRWDGKKEVALVGPQRNVCIVDSAGTLHEDRFVATREFEETGQIIHYSKEAIRELFIKNGFYDALKRARAAGQPDPDYPEVSTEDIQEISHRFARFSHDYSTAVSVIF